MVRDGRAGIPNLSSINYNKMGIPFEFSPHSSLIGGIVEMAKRMLLYKLFILK